MSQRNSALDKCNKVFITQILHTLSEKSFQSIQANPICIGKNTSIIIVPLKEIRDEEPYFSTTILIFSFIWAGLAALHKASTI